MWIHGHITTNVMSCLDYLKADLVEIRKLLYVFFQLNQAHGVKLVVIYFVHSTIVHQYLLYYRCGLSLQHSVICKLTMGRLTFPFQAFFQLNGPYLCVGDVPSDVHLGIAYSRGG